MFSFRQWFLDYHRKRMTELGKELEEALRDDSWTLSQHLLTHKKSGIALWIASGRTWLRVYDVPSTPYGDRHLRDALNRHDKWVLWLYYKAAVNAADKMPVSTTLNLLRLARQHKEN